MVDCKFFWIAVCQIISGLCVSARLFTTERDNIMASTLRGMFENETYTSMLEKYRECHKQFIANNVGYTRIPGTQDIAVRYRYTNIVLFKENGEIILNNGGYQTVSTKAHMNAVLSGIAIIAQEYNTWYVYLSCSKHTDGHYEKYVYKNGMQIWNTPNTLEKRVASTEKLF